MGIEIVMVCMTSLSVREKLRGTGRLGYLHSFHDLKNISMTVTLSCKGFISPQVGNTYEQFESENSLVFLNMMAAIRLNLFIRP